LKLLPTQISLPQTSFQLAKSKENKLSLTFLQISSPPVCTSKPAWQIPFPKCLCTSKNIESSSANERPKQTELDIDGKFIYKNGAPAGVCVEHVRHFRLANDGKTSFVNEIFALSFTMQYSEQQRQMQAIGRSQYLLKNKNIKMCTQFPALFPMCACIVASNIFHVPNNAPLVISIHSIVTFHSSLCKSCSENIFYFPHGKCALETFFQLRACSEHFFPR
jgi:hypothetical protein